MKERTDSTHVTAFQNLWNQTLGTYKSQVPPVYNTQTFPWFCFYGADTALKTMMKQWMTHKKTLNRESKIRWMDRQSQKSTSTASARRQQAEHEARMRLAGRRNRHEPDELLKNLDTQMKEVSFFLIW